MARLKTATTVFGQTFRQFVSSHGGRLKTAVLILAALILLPKGWRLASAAFFDPPPPPPRNPELVVTLTSSPAGARVVRLSDGKAAGTTPTREVHIADGSTVNYLFHLNGFVDVQVPIALDSGGDRTVHVDLRPVLAAPSAPSARRAAPARPGTRRASAAGSTGETSARLATPPSPRPEAAATPPTELGLDDPARPLLPATRVRHLGQR
jgi:hypothetical protein